MIPNKKKIKFSILYLMIWGGAKICFWQTKSLNSWWANSQLGEANSKKFGAYAPFFFFVSNPPYFENVPAVQHPWFIYI